MVFAPLPVMALDDEAMMARAETILFGQPNKGETLEARLETAERQVFGKRKGGSIDERLERLSSTLLLHRTPNNAVIAIPKENTEEKKTRKGDYDYYKAQKEEKERVKQAEKFAKRKNSNSKKYKFEEAERKPETNQEAQKEVTKAEPEASSALSKKVELSPPVEVSKVSEEVKPAQSEAKANSPVSEITQTSKPDVVKRVEISETQNFNKTTPKKAAVAGKTPSSPAANTTSSLKALTPKSDTASIAAAKPAQANNSKVANSISPSNAATNRIKRTINEQTQRAAALLREGMQAHSEGNDAKAEHLFKQVVLLQPRNPDGYFNLGAVAEQKGDLAGALMSYRAALNLNPHDSELKEAVSAVEGMLDSNSGSTSVAQSSNNKNKGTASGAKSNSKSGSSTPKSSPQATTYPPAAPDHLVHAEQAASNSDRFSDDGGSYYGAGYRKSRHAHGNVYPNNAPELTTRSIQDAAVAEVSDNPAPELSVTPNSAPVVNANQPQPFQLATARSRANSTANQNNNRQRPGGNGTARAVMGVALSVGTSYALRASGLHCPICRIGGGGGGLRSLLRF